jgi:hypothetical protein
MIDKREAILVRLRDIIETVPGVKAAGRNRQDVTGKARPAILLHDGDEQTENNKETAPRFSAVDKATMTPQLVILAGTTTEQLGTTLNGIRAALLPLVLQDPELINLCGGPNSNSQIRYEGCAVTSEAGEAREGRMECNFAFEYVFKVSDLAP